MSDASDIPAGPSGIPASASGAADPAWAPPTGPSAGPAAGQGSGAAAVVADRPEIAVGAAFAGGLLFALILKRLAR
ncbi:MAG TPA: hypothetical protein VF781_14190 [Solirubrobacteraceae bacterium]